MSDVLHDEARGDYTPTEDALREAWKFYSPSPSEVAEAEFDRAFAARPRPPRTEADRAAVSHLLGAVMAEEDSTDTIPDELFDRMKAKILDLLFDAEFVIVKRDGAEKPHSCDVCGSPEYTLTTPGAIRLCAEHGGGR